MKKFPFKTGLLILTLLIAITQSAYLTKAYYTSHPGSTDYISNIQVYPNPYNPSKSSGSITFEAINPSSNFFIYAVIEGVDAEGQENKPVPSSLYKTSINQGTNKLPWSNNGILSSLKDGNYSIILFLTESTNNGPEKLLEIHETPFTIDTRAI